MRAINGKEKLKPEGVYGSSSMIECEHPDCKETFEFNQKYPLKKYHSKVCKNAHHKIEGEAGKKFLARGKIHAAMLEKSPDRLQVVAKFLSDGKPHSTREIIRECDVCAVNAIADELREPQNGFDINCERKGKYWYYKMLGGQSQLLRIVEWISSQDHSPRYLTTHLAPKIKA